MARPLTLIIHETKEELEKRLKAQTSASSKERLQMLYWLKLGFVNSRKELADLLARNEATITRWLGKYKQGGLGALLEVKHAIGKKTVVSKEAKTKLQQRLQQPQGFRSYGEVQQWLEQECEVQAAYKTVHKLVRYKLQAKLKVPRPILPEATPTGAGAI